jgi:hypothetical protein
LKRRAVDGLEDDDGELAGRESGVVLGLGIHLDERAPEPRTLLALRDPRPHAPALSARDDRLAALAPDRLEHDHRHADPLLPGRPYREYVGAG